MGHGIACRAIVSLPSGVAVVYVPGRMFYAARGAIGSHRALFEIFNEVVTLPYQLLLPLADFMM